MFRLFPFWRCVFLSQGAQTNYSRFDRPDRGYFLFCKLSTLYPGYILKGQVHHSMRGLRGGTERPRFCHINKRNYRVQRIEKKTTSNLCQLLTTSSVHEGPNHVTEPWKKDFFPLFVCLFVYFCHRHFSFYSFRIFPSAFSHPHPRSASVRSVHVLQTPLLTLLTANTVLTRGLPVDQIY